MRPGPGLIWGFLPALTAAGLVASPPVMGAAPVTFSNTNTIVINDSMNPPALAAPYPSTIVATGLTGRVVTKATVTLSGLSHTFPSDIDILLVGPRGQMATLMAEVGGSTPFSVTNLTLTLDDDAANPLPIDAPLVSGTFKPTKRIPVLPFDLPSPAPPGNSNAVAALSALNSTDPNGTWKLFVVDDTAYDSGNIQGGWSLALWTRPDLLFIASADTNIVLSWIDSGWTLQTAPSLPPPVAWTNVPTPPVVVSGQFVVTNPASSGRQFYRLLEQN